MYRIMIIILLGFGVMFAHTTKLDKIGQNILVAGDKVDISRCDRFNWCKVKGKDRKRQRPIYTKTVFQKDWQKNFADETKQKIFSYTLL